MSLEDAKKQIDRNINSIIDCKEEGKTFEETLIECSLSLTNNKYIKLLAQIVFESNNSDETHLKNLIADYKGSISKAEFIDKIEVFVCFRNIYVKGKIS